MKKFFNISFIILVVLITLLPAISYAAGVTSLIPCTKANSPEDPSPKAPSGLNCNSWQDVVGVINFLITYAFVIATVLATVSFAYAGWLYLTANGKPDQVSRAHGIFLRVLKGFIFMGLAYLLVHTILKTIANADYSLLQ